MWILFILTFAIHTPLGFAYFLCLVSENNTRDEFLKILCEWPLIVFRNGERIRGVDRKRLPSLSLSILRNVCRAKCGRGNEETCWRELMETRISPAEDGHALLPDTEYVLLPAFSTAER